MATTTSTPSLQPLEHAKETLQGMIIALEQRFGCQPTLDKGTTLNTKFNVYPDALPKNPQTVGYFMMGNGGRKSDNTTLSSAQFALGTNMSVYRPLPFRAVPFEQDLSDPERAKYAMRRLQMIDGTWYCLYYLKKIDFTQGPVQLLRTDPISGEQTTYNIDYDNLSPQPPVTGSNGVISDVADAVSVVLPASLVITGEEVLEAIALLHGGDPREAVVSEIGFVSASTETVSVADFAGRPFDYQEAIFARMVDHYNWVGQPVMSTVDTWSKNLLFSMKNLINQS